MQNFRKIMINCVLYCSLFVVLACTAFAVPNRPTLLQPADKDSCVTKEYMFVWQQEVLINGYSLQISSNATFENIVFDNPVNTTYAVVDLPNYNTKYWWRVIVRFENGDKDTSDVRTFKTKYSEPTDLLPIDMQGCLLTDIHFSWTRPDTSLRYRLQIAEADDFAVTILDTTLKHVGSFDWKAPQNNKKYYWRMCTVVRWDCSSEWTPTRNFATAFHAPVIESPLDKQFGLEQSFSLYWNYDIEHDSYGLQVSENSDMSEPFINVQNLASPSFTLSGLDLNKTYYWRVNAVVIGCTSDWTEITSFTTKFPAPTLISPNIEAECISKTTEFLWHAVPTARGYSLLVSTKSDFADTVAFVRNINDTTALVSVPSGLTTYYWKVRGEDSKNVGDWSSVYYYNTTFNAPALLLPQNNEIVDVKTELRWNNDYTNEEFIVQVASANDFAANNLVFCDTVNTAKIDVTLPNYGAKYFWRVAVLNVMNCRGMWTEARELSTILPAPTLISPENNSVNTPTVPTLTWSPVEGAETYCVYYSKDTNNIKAQSYCGLSSTQITIPQLESNTTYYWCAVAYNGVYGKISERYSFTTIGDVPKTPNIIYPGNNSTMIPLDVELQWEELENATSYKLIFATDSKMNNIAFNEENLESNVYSISGLKNFTNYYFKVAAVNQNGSSEWSKVYTFRTTAVLPKNAPVLVAPAFGSDEHDMYVQLQWNPVETCDKYYVQVAKSEEFTAESMVLDDSVQTKISRDFIAPQYGVTYFWRVQASNEIGKSDWSEIWQFSIKPDPLGVDDEITSVSLSVKPNPASERFILNFNTNDAVSADIIIIDASGAVVETLSNRAIAAGNSQFEFDTQKLNSGTYFINVVTEKSTFTHKVTIIK